MTQATCCRLCGGRNLDLVADLGPLPISRPHLPRPGEEPRYPLAVHVCAGCGLLQVVTPIPADSLYVDAENYTTSFQSHPHVSELIRMLLAHTDAASVVEIGCNDGGFLEQLRGAGFGPLVGIEPNPQAARMAAAKGFQVHQTYLTEDLAGEIVARIGRVDLVAARHVVEHVTDLDAFFRGIRRLLRPGGYFLLELPHTEPGLSAGNPCLLWEEHVNYFTEPVILGMLAKYGYVTEAKRLYTFGGGIIAFLARRVGDEREVQPAPAHPWEDLRQYGPRTTAFRDGLRELAATAKSAGWEIAVYGAANRSNTVINHAGIGDDVDWIVDDRSDLAEQTFPGVTASIRPLAALPSSARGLLCLLGVGAEAERKVSARVRERFADRPLLFASLCYPRDALAGFRDAVAALRSPR